MNGIKRYYHWEVKNMPKYCYNYDSGNYEYIDENGYSWDQGEFAHNWDDSEYRRQREEEEERNLWNVSF